jgi:hypothetical protein
MPNADSTLAWSNFSSAPDFYLAPANTLGNIAAFNPLSGEDFFASVLFKVGAGWLGAPLTVPCSLFGNLTTAASGWAILLGPDALEADLPYSIFATSGVSQPEYAKYPLVPTTAQSPAADFVERLILATLHYDATPGSETLNLYVNGNLVATRAQSIPYVDGVVVPVVGNSQVTPSPAEGIEIIGAGFRAIATASVIAAGGVATLMAAHFRACRETNNMSLLFAFIQAGNVDFGQRWNAADTTCAEPGTTVRAPNTVNEVFVYDAPPQLAVAGSEVPDSGNFGYDAIAGVAAIPLVVTGAGIILRKTLHPDWYSGTAYAPPGGVTPAEFQGFSALLVVSGNYTVPAGITRLEYELRGGGGGSAGAQADGTNGQAGGGGGEGAITRGSLVVTPAAIIACVIGAPGAAGSDASGAGGNGGATTFNAGAITAPGGSGAPAPAGGTSGNAIPSAAPGGAGGVGGVGGSIMLSGAPGGPGLVLSARVAVGGTGGGGDGGLGTVAIEGNAVGVNGTLGGGGSGAAKANEGVPTGRAGATGGGGYISLKLYGT